MLPKTPQASWVDLTPQTSKISDYILDDTANGPGIRVSIWVTGCMFACPECFNARIWQFNPHIKTIEYDKKLEHKLLKALKNPYVQGLSILGGEPFLNTITLNQLTDKIRQKLPEKDIWCWTGYTIEQLLEFNDPNQIHLLNNITTLVDGPFLADQKDLKLKYRGSNNQRVIDVAEYLANNAPSTGQAGTKSYYKQGIRYEKT